LQNYLKIIADAETDADADVVDDEMDSSRAARALDNFFVNKAKSFHQSGIFLKDGEGSPDKLEIIVDCQ